MQRIDEMMQGVLGAAGLGVLVRKKRWGEKG